MQLTCWLPAQSSAESHSGRSQYRERPACCAGRVPFVQCGALAPNLLGVLHERLAQDGSERHDEGCAQVHARVRSRTKLYARRRTHARTRTRLHLHLAIYVSVRHESRHVGSSWLLYWWLYSAFVSMVRSGIVTLIPLAVTLIPLTVARPLHISLYQHSTASDYPTPARGTHAPKTRPIGSRNDWRVRWRAQHPAGGAPRVPQ